MIDLDQLNATHDVAARVGAMKKPEPSDVRAVATLTLNLYATLQSLTRRSLDAEHAVTKATAQRILSADDLRDVVVSDVHELARTITQTLVPAIHDALEARGLADDGENTMRSRRTTSTTTRGSALRSIRANWIKAHPGASAADFARHADLIIREMASTAAKERCIREGKPERFTRYLAEETRASEHHRDALGVL